VCISIHIYVVYMYIYIYIYVYETYDFTEEIIKFEALLCDINIAIKEKEGAYIYTYLCSIYVYIHIYMYIKHVIVQKKLLSLRRYYVILI
jgi:hypothetical protein